MYPVNDVEIILFLVLTGLLPNSSYLKDETMFDVANVLVPRPCFSFLLKRRIFKMGQVPIANATLC